MKFRLLLFILGQKMKKAAKSNNAFRNFIKGKNIRVAMKTADGRQGKAFVIQEGHVRTSAMDQSPADAAFIWCDGDTAFSIMSSGDDEAFVAALTEKKLRPEGDFKEFLWFLTALGKMSVQKR
jgi:hypothetical protein